MNIDKRKFLFKAAIVGLLGATLAPYGYANLATDTLGNSVYIWVTFLNFVAHFKIVLLFWLAFENLLDTKSWIFVGAIGSFFYALSVGLFLGLITPEPSKFIVIIERLLTGAISAIPIGIILRSQSRKGYWWIGANAIGYLFLELFTDFLNYIYRLSFVTQVLSYSLPTREVILDTGWGIARALYGLLLGIFLYHIIESKASEANSP